MLWVVGEVNEQSPRERERERESLLVKCRSSLIQIQTMLTMWGFCFCCYPLFLQLPLWFGILLYFDGCYIGFNYSFLIINFIVEILCDVSFMWFEPHSPFSFPHYLQSTYKKNYQYFCPCHCCYYHSFVIIMIHHSRTVLVLVWFFSN